MIEEKVKVENFEIYLASIDDLIEIKRKSGKKQDLCDVTKEQIKEYMKLSPELKLEWLEVANKFIWKYGKNKEIREKFSSEKVRFNNIGGL